MKLKIASISGAAAGLCLMLLGCPNKSNQEGKDTAPAVAETIGFSFTDVTQEAGIAFKHVTGAFGQKWLPETMGSGLAWIDFDGDGYQDLFLVNSREWTPAEKKPGQAVETNPPAGATGKLFRNLGNGKFTDVTKGSGLDVTMYGMGVCVGDYDNDGKPDLYVTALGRNYLFHNQGNGTFREVASSVGVKDGGWSTSAAWVDYDEDGKLDLIVAHYVKWTPETDIKFPRNGKLTYGTPSQYVGEPLRLYHNEGSTFKDVTKEAGLLANVEGKALQGKSLGIVICDYDNDGKPDIAVANDTEPNYLFHNEGNGKFKEVGVEMGMALPDSGVARGAMGIDACDYDRKGRESLVIGNFSNQGLSLYHNEGGVFRDDAPNAGVLQPTLLSLTFGCFFFDADNNGWMDIFIANGHVDDLIQEVQQQVSYAEQPHLFLNRGNGKFQDVADKAGAVLGQKFVARGAAYADYELRGVPGIAISTSGGPAHLLRNSGESKHKSLRLELEGTKSNRSAIGAVVEVQHPDGVQKYHVRSGSSYLSQSELPLTIGLGTQDQAAKVTVLWPSGDKTELTSLAAGRIYHVVEGKGIAAQRPFGQAAEKRTARLL
jgi:hypothetical protein